MSSIFLSHTHQDKPFVTRLALVLRERGVRVWVDEAQIQVGDSLFDKIETAIDEMDYLGVVLSPASVQSEWVRREVRQALTKEIRNKRVKVLPILLTNCAIPGFLRDKRYADFRISADFDAAVSTLMTRLYDAEPDTSIRGAQGEPPWCLQAVRAGFDFRVIEEREGRLRLTPEFIAAVHAACTEGLSTQPVEFLESGFFIMTVKAMLRTHPGGPLLEEDIKPLAAELSPRVLDYILELARSYGVIERRDDAFQLASDLKLEFARRVALKELADQPLSERADHVQPLIELCRYQILATGTGDSAHAYICAALIYYSLDSLGFFEAQRDGTKDAV